MAVICVQPEKIPLKSVTAVLYWNRLLLIEASKVQLEKHEVTVVMAVLYLNKSLGSEVIFTHDKHVA